MTSLSLVPEIANYKCKFENLVEDIIRCKFKQMNKRIIIALILLLILSTYNSQKHFKFNIKFTVKEISIENNTIFSDTEIKDQLSFYIIKILFF